MKSVVGSVWSDVLVTFNQKRWLSVVLLAMVASVMACRALDALDGIGHANQWDLLLEVMDNPVWVILVWPLTYSSFLMDLFIRDSGAWGIHRLSRMASWGVWWGSKFVVTGLLALLFSTTVFIVVEIVALFTVPLSMTWSPLIVQTHWGYWGGLSAAWWRVPPPVVGLLLLALWTGGLWALGSVLGVLVVCAPQGVLSWSVIALILLISYGSWNVDPTVLRWLPSVQMLLKVHTLPSQHLSVIWSGLYEGFLIIGTFFLGLGIHCSYEP